MPQTTQMIIFPITKEYGIPWIGLLIAAMCFWMIDYGIKIVFYMYTSRKKKIITLNGCNTSRPARRTGCLRIHSGSTDSIVAHRIHLSRESVRRTDHSRPAL